MSFPINSKKDYHEAMVRIYDLMNKGEQNLTPDELNVLSKMTVAVEKYEDEDLKLSGLQDR